MNAPDRIWLHPITDDDFQDVWFTEGQDGDVPYVPEAALAEAHATIARLEAALAHIDALDPEGMIDGCSQAATRGLVLQMGQIARAALLNKPDAPSA